jgi:hypothetical protein
MTEKELQEIDARIAELEAQSDEYERQIKELEEKKSQVDEKISDLETQASTYRVLNSINDVTEENSMQVWLSKDTRTTPVMSKFCDSDKSFLTIPEFMYPRAFLLVVTKYHYGIQYIDSGMTMTDLKQEGCSSESRVKKIAMSDQKTRMSALYKELYKVITKPINAGDKIPFEYPVRLGGQTYNNQTGYGRTYYGYDEYEEGTLYGETTGFVVIGIIGKDWPVY